MTPLVLTLPMPPRLTNSGSGRSRHWRSMWREKQDYFEKLNLMRAAGVFPKPLYPTPQLAEIHVRMYLGAMMDHDGAMARMKWPLDWLVGERYIANDSPRYLKWAGLPEQVVKRDGNYRITLTITPLEVSVTR